MGAGGESEHGRQVGQGFSEAVGSTAKPPGSPHTCEVTF